jgi:hypothetical protein
MAMTQSQTQETVATKRPVGGKVIETPDFLKPKVGEGLRGFVTETQDVKTKGGQTSKRYVFKECAGKPWILPGDADLNRKIKQVIDKHGFGARELYIELTSETVDVGKPSPMKVWFVTDVTGG